MSSIRKLFSADEWEWFCKIGASYSDPEQKKVFFEAIKEKKMENPNYSLFSDFPKASGSADSADPTYTESASPVNNAPKQHTKHHQFKGAEICQAIINKLSPGGKSA